MQDLDYGVALYDYFQQDYFNALSELLIAEKTGSIKHHTDFAKVLRGGIHLSYGMEEEARNIFYQIIEQGKAQSHLDNSGLSNGVVNTVASNIAQSSNAEGGLLGASKKASNENIARAWFYLGKLLYKKGEFLPAAENLEKVSKSLSRDLHPEFAFLIDAVGRHSRKAGNADSAVATELPVAQFKPKIPTGSSWSFYKTFNVLLERIVEHESIIDDQASDEPADYYPLNDGVTDDLLAEQREAAAQQEEQAIASGEDLDVLIGEPALTGDMPLKHKLKNNVRVARALESLAARVGRSHAVAETEELMSLKDKIHTTAGFLYLHVGKPRRAVKNFKRVRGDSVLVGQALLGYGWAAANKGDYRAALKPLQVLASRPMLEQTTHEAHLALPYVYEKMEAHTAALEGYDRAATVMQQELELLSSLKDDLRAVAPENLHKYYDRESVKWLAASASQAAVVKKQLFVTEVLKSRLLKLMTKNQFSLLENQRQDIAWLQAKLSQWEIDLETMRFVIEARQQHSRQAISPEARVALVARAERIDALRGVILKKYRALLAQPNEAEAQSQFAQAGQQATWQRVGAANQRVADIEQWLKSDANENLRDALVSELDSAGFYQQKNKLRLAKGMMVWQFSEQHAARRWHLDKNLAEVDTALASAQGEIGQLDTLVAEAERQSAEYQRLTELQQDVATQNRQAGELAKVLNTRILALLLDDVGRMQQQTQVYLAQARLARARMLDNLSYEDFEILSDESTGAAPIDADSAAAAQPLSMMEQH
ncbi:MAG: hypothetical protein HKO71_06715 [Pseudomonadales bacterium]|nr:hypothetical protein [Pseudomonadales bacterium]